MNDLERRLAWIEYRQRLIISLLWQIGRLVLGVVIGVHPDGRTLKLQMTIDPYDAPDFENLRRVAQQRLDQLELHKIENFQKYGFDLGPPGEEKGDG